MPRWFLCALLPVAACGGGGGSAPASVPGATAARLAAAAVEIGPAANAHGELEVRLEAVPSDGPCLLELAVDLPPAVTVPATDRLAPATPAPLPTLDGDFVGAAFHVLCGDAANAAAAPLAVGPLFRLRLVAATPRQPGTHRVRLRPLRAATAPGAAAPFDVAPLDVDVVVR
jgi:hypothetical protein